MVWTEGAVLPTHVLLRGADGRHMDEREHLHHVHVHLGSQAATVGLYVRAVFSVGFSITVHGPDEFYDAQGQHLTEKIAAADFICCISFFCRSQLMKFSPYSDWHKLIVSRLGVNTAEFSPKPLRNAPEPFSILCVGRLVPAKGQHQLIDAVERLARQGRRVRLHLVGAGPDEASLRQRVSQFDRPRNGGVRRSSEPRSHPCPVRRGGPVLYLQLCGGDPHRSDGSHGIRNPLCHHADHRNSRADPHWYRWAAGGTV